MKRKGLQERDMKMGQALAKTIREMALEEGCPSSEGLAALVDGRLEGREKDSLLNHLSHCDACYEVFLMSHEMEKEEVMIVEEKSRKRRPFSPYALAAGLLLPLISGYLVYRNFTLPAGPSKSAIRVQKKQKPIFFARVRLDSAMKKFILTAKEKVIRDDRTITEFINLLKIERTKIKDYRINEVRIERPDLAVKAFFVLPDEAEVEIKDGVLLLRFPK